MSRIKEIKNRIKSVKDVQQITKAMKMVSAARLRKIESRFNYASKYDARVENELSFIFNRNSWAKISLMREKEVSKTGFIVFSGDKGLCGGFNMNVFKKAISVTKNISHEDLSILGVGKKGNSLLRKQGFKLLMDVQGIFGKVRYKDAVSISKNIVDLFKKGEFNSLSIVLNRFKSKDEPVQVIPLLPFSVEEKEYEDLDYHYDQNVESLLEKYMSYCLSVKIYKYLLESEAAEFLARMTAMDSASNNAADLIENLSLEYNRARQAAITKEILDIVGGAEALK